MDGIFVRMLISDQKLCASYFVLTLLTVDMLKFTYIHYFKYIVNGINLWVSFGIHI
jgi:hypothetical protein